MLFFGKGNGEEGFPCFGKVGNGKAGVVQGKEERNGIGRRNFEECVEYIVFARGCEGVERVSD